MRRLLAAALLAALVAPAAPAQETDLAEAARREKARRKAQKKEGVTATTFTDEDLKAERDAALVSTPGGTKATRPSGASSPAGGSEADPKSWFTRAETLRKAIAAQEQRVPQLERQIAELRNDVAPNPADLLDPNRLQKREAEIHRLLAEIEAAQGELARSKQALGDLEDEARSKGVPPGWLEGRFSG